AFNFVVYMVYRSDGGLWHRIGSMRGQIVSRWHWVVVAAVFTTSYRLLQMKAFSLAMVSLVVPIKRLSTLLATVLGGELFGEEHLLRKSLGCVLMIAGAYLIIVM
ncbi:MAG: EamA family transporter, partial [Candidatus Nanohaloarchaea archaeon]|nr:EamA family transporter [Candidatus Nanohaloarchaea archaeon]